MPNCLVCCLKVDLLRAIFRFLDAAAAEMSSDERARLAGMASVLADDGHVLVRPCQIVLNMYDSDQIPPYLYRLPLELGEHRALLVSLGATDRATVGQYADVLAQLRHEVLVPFSHCTLPSVL